MLIRPRAHDVFDKAINDQEKKVIKEYPRARSRGPVTKKEGGKAFSNKALPISPSRVRLEIEHKCELQELTAHWVGWQLRAQAMPTSETNVVPGKQRSSNISIESQLMTEIKPIVDQKMGTRPVAMQLSANELKDIKWQLKEKG
jgi:hypothetical protein